MDALTAINAKRDTRGYLDKPVPDDVVERLLNAARMAGSAKNAQPIRLIVVSDAEAKSALTAGGDFAAWIDQAPLLVVLTVTAAAGPRRLFDIGRHAQNLMVAATAEGLATCPVTLHHQDVVRQLLAIPADVEAPMVITLGWPAEAAVSAPSPIAGPRLALDEYVKHGSW